MTGARAPQQEVWPVFLLPFLMLLLLVISVVGDTCGCWGTNQVYVHYKPPVSGWFTLSPNIKRKFLFERVYPVRTPEPQMHHFQLRYMVSRRNWLLMEKKDRRWKLLSRSNDKSSKPFIVSCPTGQCSCWAVHVEGSSCWSINGQYTKYTDNSQPPRNLAYAKPNDNKERRSECLLAHLVQCLNETKIARNTTEDSCQQYTEALTTNITLVRQHEHYRNHMYYNLTKAPKHDFWLIESENNVYAVSRNTGPCPDQLTPDSTTWLRTDNFTENITVICTTWDNPSGD